MTHWLRASSEFDVGMNLDGEMLEEGVKAPLAPPAPGLPFDPWCPDDPVDPEAA